MDGLLLIDKSPGMTSFDVIRRVRKLVHQRKAGHTGTLDPAATGLLPVTLGACTRLANFVDLEPKVYRFEIVFGTETDTCDDEGETVETGSAHVDESALRGILGEFVGDIEQVPPRYSAVHVDGKRAYELARAGVEFELPARSVRVDRFQIVQVRDGSVEVEVECGGGTYMRSLARDVARAAGSVGHARGIRRTRVGAWTVADAVTLEELERRDPDDVVVKPLAMMTATRRAFEVDAEQLGRIRHGNFVELDGPTFDDEEFVAISASGELVAVAQATRSGDRTILKPRRVLAV